MSRGWKRYTENQITTGHPIKITIMAYERCILNLRIARERINELKYREAEERLINTEQILNELTMQIESKVFPELAENLYNLYGWCIQEIRSINIKKKAEMCEPVIVVIQDLLDGFKGALNNSER